MPVSYERPKSLNDALGILSSGDWTVLAGGTDIYPAATDAFAWGRPSPQHILDITGIDALSGIEDSGEAYRIGSRVTWTEMIEADLPDYFECLRQAGREVGGVQIQNRATIAGNICNASPAADGVPALMALDAKVEIGALDGRRTMPLETFIHGNRRTALDKGELVTAIIIPKRAPHSRSEFLKLGARRYLVISIAMVAGVIEIDADANVSHARIVVGSCSEVAQRLPGLEDAMLGTPLSRDLSALLTPEMLTPLSPIDDVRGDAAYRLGAADTLVRRLLTSFGDAP